MLKFGLKAFCFIFLVGVTSLAFLPISAHAVTLNTTADGYIEDTGKDGNPDLIINSNALLTGTGTLTSGAGYELRSIMNFSLGSYAGNTLASARLSGYGRRVGSNGNLPIGLGLYLSAGDGSISLNDFSQSASYLEDITLPGGSQTDFFDFGLWQIDVTSGVQELLDNSDLYAEFRLQSSKETGYISATDMDPSYSSDPYRGVQLELIFSPSPAVPEPGTLLLVGFGAFGTLSRLIRKKK
ncbi:MAG: PEP-CTERM sorting domain-containing protein [Candidatus Omnitrophota bacterium]